MTKLAFILLTNSVLSLFFLLNFFKEYPKVYLQQADKRLQGKIICIFPI